MLTVAEYLLPNTDLVTRCHGVFDDSPAGQRDAKRRLRDCLLNSSDDDDRGFVVTPLGPALEEMHRTLSSLVDAATDYAGDDPRRLAKMANAMNEAAKLLEAVGPFAEASEEVAPAAAI